MKKKIIPILFTAIIVASTSVYASFDYSTLDSMTLEELQKLYSEVGQKIDSLKGSENDANTENTGAWVVKHYIDEFNQPTENGYITTNNYLEGAFSNSATTDSLLYVVPLFDEKVSFKLAEYGKNIVKGYMSSGTDYKFTILSPNGEKYNMTGILRNGADRVTLDSKYTPYFYDILNENGTVKVLVTESDHPATKYYFEIPDSSFFNNAYLQLFESVPHHNYGTAEEIEVTMDISASIGDDRIPIITIESNIPDAVCIHVLVWFGFNDSIEKDIYLSNGICTFSVGKSATLSVFKVNVSFGKQTSDVFSLYGDGLEKLTGEIAKTMLNDFYQETFSF